VSGGKIVAVLRLSAGENACVVRVSVGEPVGVLTDSARELLVK